MKSIKRLFFVTAAAGGMLSLCNCCCTRGASCCAKPGAACCATPGAACCVKKG